MSRRALRGLFVIVAVLGGGLACSKAKRDGAPAAEGASGATPGSAEAAARDFLAAVARGDLEAAGKWLPDEATCGQFEPDAAEKCRASVPKLHARLPAFAADLKGFRAGTLEDTTPADVDMPPGLRRVAVRPASGGGRPIELITIDGHPGFRIAFPMKLDKHSVPPPATVPNG